MSPNMKMETEGGGSFGKAMSRLFTGETVFRNRYTAVGKGMIAFAGSFPGTITAVEITPDSPIIVQKSAFLASFGDINTEVTFSKKFSSGLFGGEGFIMEKISGSGTVFLEIDGSVFTYELGAGEQLIIDTGYLASMDASCTMSLERIKGAKNVLFGGEGLFNTVVTGPGKVTVQSMPLPVFAQSLSGYFAGKNS